VEQPIGSKVPPTHAAGVDPAYVPGLLPPRPAADAAQAPEKAAEEVEDAPAAEPADAKEPAAEDAADDAPGQDAAVSSEGGDAADSDEDAEGEDAEEDADDGKPVFEVSDRRGSITADRRGVTFTLDGEVAEFGWDEVQAVEIDTPRFGRRFSVTVYTSTRRWFQSDVEAPSRGELKTWTAQLDEVLDARFEEGGEPAEAEAAADLDAEGTDADAETVDATEAATDSGPDEPADEPADEDGDKAGEKPSAEAKGAQARA
jgi:hypothetical protein